MHYLDRHNVTCPEKSGMTGFQLVQPVVPDNTIRMEYSCAAGTDFAAPSAKRETAAVDRLPATANARQLKGLDVSCPAGTVISQWHLGRPGWPTVDQIGIDYSCTTVPGLDSGKCENLTTGWAEQGPTSTGFVPTYNLMKHKVTCPVGKMLTRWQLAEDGPGKNWRYEYTCCGR